MRRRLIALFAIAPLAVSSAAFAFWTGHGSGVASASTATVNPPTGATASTTPGIGTVHLGWNAAALSNGHAVGGYYATRVRTSDNATAAACGTSVASPTTALTCDDLLVPDGVYRYVITAVHESWTASGNPTNDVTVINDSTPPSVTINQASGQADPTNASPVTFTVAFSEPVVEFDNADVTLSGTAGATTALVLGSGAAYTVAVSGMTGSGTVIASLAAGVAKDAAGNLSLASTSSDNTVTYDTAAPAVTVNQKSTQLDPASNLPILYTVTFSEPVTGFDQTDLTRTGTSVGGTVAVTGTGADYEISVSGTPTGGTLTFSIDAGKAQDLAGNGNTASTSTDNTVTYNYTGPANSLSLDLSTGAYLSGPTLYFAGDLAGSFRLLNTITDAQSTPASTNYPAIATTGWTHGNQTVTTPTGGPYLSSTFSWNTGAAVPADYTVTGKNTNNQTTPSVVHFVNDNTPPTGNISYPNGYVNTLSVPVTVTPASDVGSGLNTDLTVIQRAEADLLENGSCGTFGAFNTIELSGNADNDVFSGTCYMYQYVIWDNVDHIVTVAPTSIAKVNTEVLAGGSVSYVDGYITTTTAAITVNQGTGGVSSQVQRKSATLSNGNCGAFGAFGNITLSGSNDTVTTANCYMYQLIVTDQFGATATYTSTSVLKVDTTGPTGGTISYTNGYVTTASIPVTVGTATDAQSGVTNNVQRASATLSNTTGNCGTIGSFTGITLVGGADTTAVSGNCYQYRMIPTNGAGLNGTTATSASVVKYDNAPPTGGSIDYTDGYDTASPIPVTVVTGTDAGSGVNTSQVQRASATLTANVCGTFGSFGNITLSSGNDTGPSNNTCYMYRYVVTDRAGLATTYTSTKVVKFDNAAPSMTNAGSNSSNGKMETGNTLVLTFGEALNPATVPIGTNTVTVTEQRSGSSATLTIPGIIATASISTGYVTTNPGTVTAPGSVTLSADGKTLTVTLGTVTGPAGTSSSNVTIAPASTLKDYAGFSATGSDSMSQLF